MAVSSLGTGSTIDVNSIVTQLMSVESQGLTKLQAKEASYTAKLSAFGQVSSAFSSFQSAVKSLSTAQQFQGATVTTADPTVVTAATGASAVPGSYAIEVSKLAQAQKLVTTGQTSTTAAVGTGTLTFDFGTIAGGAKDVTGRYAGSTFTSAGTGVKSVTIDTTNNSLSGIRDAINAAGIGVSATIVNDGSTTPYRLVLTDKTTGSANSMKISVAGSAPLSALLAQDPGAPPASQALSETISAQNAQFTVDGLAVSKSSNVVTDVITGVTLSLAKTNVGTPTTVTVARDNAAVVAAVGKFVSAYNAVNKTLSDASAYDPVAKRGAILNGDSSIRLAQSGLRSVLGQGIQGGYGALSRLSDVGVSLQKDGTLALDSTKLTKALTTNFDDVAGIFATTGKASDSLVSYTSSSADTKAGAYALNVTQLAAQASTAGSAAAGLTITAGGNDALAVTLNGLTANITLAAGSYATADALAAEVQAKINGSAAFSGSTVKVTQTAGTISIATDAFGSDTGISVTGLGASNLFGGAPTVSPGLNAAGTIDGVAATGRGQTLVAPLNAPSSGLQVQINGGTLGARGTINFSRGYAVQFNDFATRISGAGGSLESRTKGLNSSVASLQKDEANESSRLTTKEAALRKQYSDLDSKLSSLSNMSNYLSQQLASLPKPY